MQQEQQEHHEHHEYHEHHKHHQHRLGRKLRWFKSFFEKNQSPKARAVVVTLVFLLVVLLLLGAVRFWEKRYDAQQAALIEERIRSNEVNEDMVRYGGKWYERRDDLETILLIGVDKFDSQIQSSEEDFFNDQQADFLMLLILDKEEESFSVLQLNRDTMVDVPILDLMGQPYGTKYQQLALAHTYGNGGRDSCRNTVKAVSNLLYGIDIDYYVKVTMNVVPIVNDLLGGVTVYVEDDFSDTDPTILQGEEMTLDGDQALTFIRARSSMQEATNLNRMERQRTYLKALYQAAVKQTAMDKAFPGEVLDAIGEYILTDSPSNQLIQMVIDVGSYRPAESIETIDGEAIVGEEYMEYYVEEDALQKKVLDLFYKEAE